MIIYNSKPMNKYAISEMWDDNENTLSPLGYIYDH